MTVNYSNNSPYKNTLQSSWYLSNWEPIEIPALDSDQLIVLKAAYVNRPDLLAYDLYSTTRLWWVFSVRNPNVIKDPIYDMKEGIELYVTDKDTLLGLLNA